MNREPYMSRAEYTTVMMMALCKTELEKAVAHCRDDKWRRKLKCAVTYLHNVLHERGDCLDKDAEKTFQRRLEKTKISMTSADLVRKSNVVNGGDDLLEITVNLGAFYDLADLALNSCRACAQGKECVENCYYKAVMLSLDVPVQRTNVEDWQCPYKTDDEVVFVNPQHQRMGNLDDKVLERYEDI